MNVENLKQASNWKSSRRRVDYSSRKPVNRITAAYSAAEIAAIRWLSRTPERDELTGRFAELRGLAQRQIARALSDQELQQLVAVFRQIHPDR